MQPTRNDYLNQAFQNRDFAYNLSQQATRAVHFQWALTSLFYAALHLINAYNAAFNFHTNSHKEMRDDLRDHPILGEIADDYADLLTYSYNARYKLRSYNRQDFEKAKAMFQRIEVLIEKHC